MTTWCSAGGKIVGLQNVLTIAFALVKIEIFFAQDRHLERISDLFRLLLQPQSVPGLTSRSIVHYDRIGANRKHGMAREGGDREEMRIGQPFVDDAFLHLAQGVRHGHASLGVRVADPDAHSSPRRNHLVRNVALLTDRVANHTEHTDHMDIRWLLLLDHLHEAGHRGRTALVPAHTGHNASGLNVRTAGIVRHALAYQHHRLARRIRWFVLEEDDATLMTLHGSGCSVHGLEQWILTLKDVRIFDDGRLDRSVSERLQHVLGHTWRCHTLRIAATDIPCHESTILERFNGTQQPLHLGRIRMVHTEATEPMALLRNILSQLQRHVQFVQSTEQSYEGRITEASDGVGQHQERLLGTGFDRSSQGSLSGLRKPTHIVKVRQLTDRTVHDAAVQIAAPEAAELRFESGIERSLLGKQ
uniref:Putative secreted protein n=1 Tax=Anopheles marajoara TaxID=58244 RepID=A0A2M4C5F5_9DIPT